MTDFGNVDAIQETFILKLHDLDLWYNATIFNCVSGLIRVQSVQFPLFIKESLQGKLRLKNKTISIIECLYDTKKNTFLPLKIELDINLEYKTGKSHLKRFLINVNDFKLTSNKSERIRTLKSVQRIFSVEAIFKLVERVQNENSLASSTFKNQSRSGLKGYNSPASKGGYSNHNIGQNRFPRTEIFYKKSPNSKGMHVKSPKKLSQCQSIDKERYQQDTNLNEEARRAQTYKSSEVVSSPSNQQKYGYQFAAYDILRSQNPVSHQRGQDPFQEEPRDLQSEKLYETYQEHLSSKEERSVKGEDSENMTEMLLEEIKSLRKKLSDVLGQKNNLYLEREKSLLQFESLDKEQKIRHKRELAQQKAYYESLLLQKDNEIQQLNIRLSQNPTELRYIQYVQNEKIEHPNPQIRSVTKGGFQLDPINLKTNPTQSNVSSSPPNKKIRLSQHFQLTSSAPLQAIQLQGITQKNENTGSKQSATQQKQKQPPSENDLQSLSEIYNERQAIEGLKRDLEAKNQEIKELRQLANEQDMELTKIKSLIEQITSAAQENQDLYSSPFPENLSNDRDQSNDGDAAIDKNNDKPLTPKQQYSFSNNGSRRINFKESGSKITQNQFEELIKKLASDIHFLEAKVKELESSNKVYSEEYNQKLNQLKNAQDEIKKTTQKVSELKQLNESLKVQINSLKSKVQQDKIQLQKKEDYLQQSMSGPQSQKRKPMIIRVNQKNQPNGKENLYDAQNQNQLSGIVQKLEQNIQTIENDISVLNEEQTQIKKLLQQTNPHRESDSQTYQQKERTKSANPVQSPSQQYLKNFNIDEMNPPQNSINQKQTSKLKENQKQSNRDLVHEQNDVYLKSKNQEASLDSKRIEEPRNRNPSVTKSLADSKEKAPKASSMSKRNYRTTKDERKRKRLEQDDECCSGCC